MKKRYTNKNILVFSDTHVPYHIPWMLDFLEECKEVFSPDRIVMDGDLVDNYGSSRFPKDPDHPDSFYNEVQKVRMVLKKLVKLFPEVLMAEGNHDHRIHIKAAGAGVPSSMLPTFNEVFGLPEEWRLKESHTLTVDNSTRDRITFAHNRGANAMLVAQRLGRTFIAGHNHSRAAVAAVNSGGTTYYGCNVPSLISNTGCPFRYSKLADINPIRGAMIIQDGVPSLLVADKKGRLLNGCGS